ncbi:anti sigma factor C-terminal domain-containing protein [Zhaonella formicivorans]|uniref:anti sigma factor C-terminal domain-containing protein n=1 Tax=Zhaonella formicivorans TaxID=2528593 RepID=UPI0010DBC9FF|nr:anti sigma factor C-terminal domain-containing protein [Zhaonella formicivorans]
MNKNQYYNDEQKVEKELDSLFDDLKNTKLKKAIKKAQWHSIFRNVLISFVVLGVMLVGGSIVNRELIYNMEMPVQIAVDSFNKISAPNKYIGKVSRYHEILGGRNEYTTYKIIEGKVVFAGEGDYSYGLLRNEWGNRIGTESPSILGASHDVGDLKEQKYNELGQREMVFFYPFISYPEYKNDLQLLDSIGSDKIMEMALSFDQAYSLDEVNKMLPNNVTLAWYWVDDLNEQEKEDSKPRKEKQQGPDGKTHEVDYPARIRSEKNAYGIKAYDVNREPLEDPAQLFIWALQNGMKYDTKYKSEFVRVYNNIAGQDGELTKEDIKVWGVVVTGDVNNLKTLRTLPFIKASSLGVVTEKY